MQLDTYDAFFWTPRKHFEIWPKKLGSLFKFDLKNLRFFRKKSFFSQEIPLDMQNAVWQSCPKIFDKIPQTFISMSKSNKKTFQKNFSSKCIRIFGMQFWRIRMKNFSIGRDMAQCPKMMKKHVFSQFVYTDTQNTFLTTLPKTFGLKLETFFSMYRTGGKHGLFFKTKNIHLQFVPLDAWNSILRNAQKLFAMKGQKFSLILQK